MRRFVLAILLAFVAPLHASDEMDAQWMQLIRQDFDPLCAVQRTKVGTNVMGNNGMRAQQWFIRTCDGEVEYWVHYYPPKAFPERDTPYEVERRFVVPLVTCIHLAEDYVTRTRGWPADRYTIRGARSVVGGRGFEIWNKADSGKRRPSATTGRRSTSNWMPIAARSCRSSSINEAERVLSQRSMSSLTSATPCGAKETHRETSRIPCGAMSLHARESVTS